jgi:hypothetical protein
MLHLAKSWEKDINRHKRLSTREAKHGTLCIRDENVQVKVALASNVFTREPQSWYQKAKVWRT